MENRESVLNTDRFDRRRFGQILEMSERLQEVEKTGRSLLPTFKPLMADLWASLYKMKPSLLENEEYDKKYQINHDFMSKIMNDTSYNQAREATRLDDLSSALGTVRYTEKVQDWIQEERKHNEELNQALQESLQAQKALQRALQKQQEAQQEKEQAQRNGDKKAESAAKRKETNSQKKAQEAQNDYDQALQQTQEQLSQSFQTNGQQFSQMMAQATQDTQQAKEDIVNLLASGGNGAGAGQGEGELQKLPLRDQIKLAELLAKNKKLKEIADWAGRFKAIARKKQKNKHVETIDRSGVTIGTDINRLLPVELAAYRNPVTKMDFLRRFAEHQTMMYAPEGKETLGKGPIVLCLDQSGSMFELDHQSKGFALALMMIAKRQRRDFAVIPFSSQTKQKTFFYEKGKVKPSDLVELAETFLGGGTNFVPPLQMAINTIEENKRFSKADIVFVTDGDPYDTAALEKFCIDPLMKKKKEHDFNVISVLIGYGCSEQYVKKFSDKVVRAKDFNDENVADAAFSI